LFVGCNYSAYSCFTNPIFVDTPDFGLEYAENGRVLVEAVVGLEFLPCDYWDYKQFA